MVGFLTDRLTHTDCGPSGSGAFTSNRFWDMMMTDDDVLKNNHYQSSVDREDQEEKERQKSWFCDVIEKKVN